MNGRCFITVVIASCLAILAPHTASAAEHDWPQWRGPTRDARLPRGVTLPNTLKATREVWRVALELSYSGPVVVGGRVFVTETANAQREVVRALDADTGTEIWRASWDGAISVPFFAKENGDWIRSTPACDGDALYVGGIRDVLVCLDAQTGAQRWRLDFSAENAALVPAFGLVCSPLIDGEHVYVQAGGALCKVDKRTGELVWRALEDGGGMNSAFSSPVIAHLSGHRQLVVQTRTLLAGVALESGEILWEHPVPSFRGMNILTPTIYGDGVLTSSYRNQTFFYRVDRSAGAFSASEAWTSKGQGYMSSPVIIDDHAYLHLGNGRLACLRLSDGEELWRSPPFGKYWSMVSDGRRILALDQRGELLLIHADPQEFRLIDRKRVSDQDTWAHLAVCGNEAYVRELRGIVKLELD